MISGANDAVHDRGAGIPTYSLHGLALDADVPLVLPTTTRPADVVFRTAEPRRPEPCAGELLASMAPGGEPFYDVWRCDGRYLLRFHGYADFLIDPALSAIRGHAHPGADPRMVAVFLEGSVLAILLVLRGELVLHASAVDGPEGVLALAGGSGAGKTSLAAGLCAGGAPLVTDDVLRLDLSHDPVLAYGGSTELRLRESLSEAASLLPGHPLRTTADGRSAVRVGAGLGEARPLRVILLPALCEGLQEPALRRLRGAEALMGLIATPRTAWCAPQPQRDLLRHLSRLVAHVPVFEARIPWRPGTAREAAASLASAVEATLARVG